MDTEHITRNSDWEWKLDSQFSHRKSGCQCYAWAKSCYSADHSLFRFQIHAEICSQMNYNPESTQARIKQTNDCLLIVFHLNLLWNTCSCLSQRPSTGHTGLRFHPMWLFLYCYYFEVLYSIKLSACFCAQDWVSSRINTDEVSSVCPWIIKNQKKNKSKFLTKCCGLHTSVFRIPRISGQLQNVL